MLRRNDKLYNHLFTMVVEKGFSVGQLPDFHAAVGAARKQSAVRVDVQLRHTRPDVLEEAALGVFGREGQEHARDRHSPNLKQIILLNFPIRNIPIIRIKFARYVLS